MKRIGSLVASCVTAVWFFAPSATFAESTPGDVVIIYDHTASTNNDYDSRAISQAWLSTFIDVFKSRHHITLAGFDDTVTEYMEIDASKTNDIPALENKVKSIPAKEEVSDFEAPIGYIQERNYVKPIAFAVVISAGRPSIWNNQSFFLSKRTRKDPRYFALNEKYSSLKKQGLSDKQLYDQLADAYFARNLKLIKVRLASLNGKLDGKLVFVDISGEFDFLKQWAEMSGARYVVVPPEQNTPPASGELKFTMQELIKIASTAMSLPMPESSPNAPEPAIPDQSAETATDLAPAKKIPEV